MKLVAGIDEAGRGPVIGPMVIAGVLVDEEKIPELVSMGVKDSKLLTAEVRVALAKKISTIAAGIAYADVQPNEIDNVVFRDTKLHRLNLLEATRMAKLISELKPATVWIDAADTNSERYGKQVMDLLPPGLERIRLVSEHKADVRYPVVSAASIMAKVRRDAAVSSLREKYGDFGSGYPSDWKTIRFLQRWRGSHADYPSMVRKSWKTIKRLEAEHAQTLLALNGSMSAKR